MPHPIHGSIKHVRKNPFAFSFFCLTNAVINIQPVCLFLCLTYLTGPLFEIPHLTKTRKLNYKHHEIYCCWYYFYWSLFLGGFALCASVCLGKKKTTSYMVRFVDSLHSLTFFSTVSDLKADQLVEILHQKVCCFLMIKWWSLLESACHDFLRFTNANRRAIRHWTKRYIARTRGASYNSKFT